MSGSAVIVDFDDFGANNHRLDLLRELKRANPAFKCTLFAVPTWGEDWFWDMVPKWCELAMHGYAHGDPPTDGGECKDWTTEQMMTAMLRKPTRFMDGFKAPGWQISDACYGPLKNSGWWLADKPYNDDRRPHGLLTHRDGDGDHWHGHIQNVCGNGLEETFAAVMARVRAADSFQFMSEVVAPWNPR